MYEIGVVKPVLTANSELNVEPKDFDILAKKSAINISTESNPRPMSKEDYLNVLNNAYNAK